MDETRRTTMAIDIVPRLVKLAGVPEFEAEMRRVRGMMRDVTALGGGPGATGAATGAGWLGAANLASNVGIGAAVGVGAFGVMATREAMATEAAANRIRAAHQLSKRDYEDYTRFIVQNSTKLLTDQKQLWEGIGAAVEHGWGIRGTEAVAAGAAKMAKVLGSDYATTVKGVTGLLGAFNIQAGQIPGALDAIAAAAQRSGLGASFLTTGAGRFLAQAQGIGASLPEALGIAAEIDRMGLGSRATGAFGSLLQRLGTLQQNPKLSSVVNVGQFGIQGSLANLLAQRWQTPQLLQQELGGGMSLTLAQRIVRAGSQGASLGDTQGALNKQFLEYSKSEAASLDKLRISVKNLEDAFGKGLIPVVQTATEDVAKITTGVEKLTEAMGPGTSKTIMQVAFAVGAVGVAYKVLRAIIAPAAGDILTAAGALKKLGTTAEETQAAIGTGEVVASGETVAVSGGATGAILALGGIAAAAIVVGGAMIYAYNKVDAFRAAVDKINSGGDSSPLGILAAIFHASPLGLLTEYNTAVVKKVAGLLGIGGGSGGPAAVPGRSGAGLNPNYSLFGLHSGAGDAFSNSPIGPTTSGIVDPTSGAWHTGQYHWDFGLGGSGNERVILPNIPKGQGKYRVWYIDYSSASDPNVRSLGKTAVVETPNGKLMLFAHLSRFGPGVKPMSGSNPIAIALAKHHLASGGSFSTSGGVIGVSGFGGTGPHLHVAADPGAVQFLASIDPSGFRGSGSGGPLNLPYAERGYSGAFASAGAQQHVDPSVLAGIGMAESSGQIGAGWTSTYGTMGVLTSQYGAGPGGQVGGAAGMLRHYINWARTHKTGANVAAAREVLARLGIHKPSENQIELVIGLAYYNAGPNGANVNSLGSRDGDGMGYALKVLGTSMSANRGAFPASYYTGQGASRVPSAPGATGAVPQVANPFATPAQPKGGWWGSGAAPTTPAGWASAWGGAASAIDQEIQNIFGPNLDITKLTPAEKALLASLTHQRAKDLFQQTRSWINQTVPGGIGSAAGQDLFQEAMARRNDAYRHPFAGYARSDPWLRHMTRTIANEQGMYGALSDKWSGVDPTTLRPGQRAQWLQDQYNRDMLWRQIHDNIAKSEFHLGKISKQTLDARLAADKFHANTLNQQARARAEGDLGPVGRVAAERVVNQCAAEERANKIRSKQQKAQEAGLEVGKAALKVQQETLKAIKALAPHAGAKSAQSVHGQQRSAGAHTVAELGN